MFTFEKPGERFFALLTAGNFSLTQGVISLLGECPSFENRLRNPEVRKI
jgi:putative proteasome-type protease